MGLGIKLQENLMGGLFGIACGGRRGLDPRSNGAHARQETVSSRRLSGTAI